MKKLKESKDERLKRIQASGCTKTRVVQSKKVYDRKKSSGTKPEDFSHLRSSILFHTGSTGLY
jgi:hypothetical protein